MRRQVCSLAVAVLVPLLGGRAALAEDGILVVHIEDTQRHPIVGLVLSTQGDGSLGSPTDAAGKTRLRLAVQTKPGQWVSLLIARQPAGEEWVPISPWDLRVRIPPFENESENFQPVVLGRKGDRALLEYGDGVKAVAKSVVAAQSPKPGEKELTEAQRQQVLTDEAARFGLQPKEVDKAIRAWGAKASDPFEKGLAALYAEHYPEAATQLAKSLQVREEKLQAAQAEVIDAASFLGEARYREGKYRDAVEAYTKAVALDANSLRNLAGLGIAQLDAGDYPKAETTLERARARTEATFAPDHPTVATALNNLAQVYHAQGQYAKAEPLLVRALKIDERARGPDHPSVAGDLSNLALVYDAQGQYTKAEPLLVRALKIDKQVLGADHPDVAMGFGDAPRSAESQFTLTGKEP